MHMVAPEGWSLLSFTSVVGASCIHHRLGLEFPTPGKHFTGISPQEMLPAVAHSSWLKRAPTLSPDFQPPGDGKPVTTIATRNKPQGPFLCPPFCRLWLV